MYRQNLKVLTIPSQPEPIEIDLQKTALIVVDMQNAFIYRKGVEWEDVPQDIRSVPCQRDEEIKDIARLAKSFEGRLGRPQDIEWAIDSGLSFLQSAFLLQTRPAKVASGKPQNPTDCILDELTKRDYEI